jgi:hypothetical protein
MGCLITVLSFSWGFSQETGRGKNLKITSPAFETNKNIPPKYGCDGENVNPPVQIENVPPGTKSLALVFDDQDAPRGTYVHWILWNVDPATKEIKENSIPEGAVQGLNDFKKNLYGGPLGGGGGRADPKSTKVDLEKTMEGHIIGRGQLMGVYKREKKK